MLYKTMSGRLGNQMFQYATMYAFSKKCGDRQIVLNFDYLGNKDFQDELQYFNVTYKTAHQKPSLSPIQKLLFSLTNINTEIIKRNKHTTLSEKLVAIHNFNIRFSSLLMKNGIYRIEQGYLPLQISNTKNKIFVGCFESSKYFDNIQNEILDIFTPKFPALPQNRKIYQAIEQSESVCVTIRRGDFVTNKNFKKRQYVCTPKYFERSVSKIQTFVKKPRFFVFSDDIEWVKHNLNFPDDTIYESGNDPVWEKIRMMYSCKHFIISNSSFSWWAQYLSRNPRKIVIAPTRWKNGYQNNDIFQTNWILVNPDS